MPMSLSRVWTSCREGTAGLADSLALVLGLVLTLGLVAGCGSSSGSGEDPNPYGFNFDRSLYPQIVTVPRTAFEEDRMTNGDDDDGVAAALFDRIRADTMTPSDDPFHADWDTLIGLASNGRPDDRVVTRFFLVYEVEHNPTAGTCTVRIRVIEGLPYDPQRAPLATYEGSATLGAMDRDGEVISVPTQCSQEAAHVAFDALLLGGHFGEGWSEGPPAHMN